MFKRPGLKRSDTSLISEANGNFLTRNLSTDEGRLKTILNTASGFLYYVTITGITGQNSANVEHLKKSVLKIKSSTKLPIVAGFGIKHRPIYCRFYISSITRVYYSFAICQSKIWFVYT